MLKHLICWSRNILVVVLMVSLTFSSWSCANGNGELSLQEQAAKALEEGYNYLVQAVYQPVNNVDNLNKALERVKNSIELSPTHEAMLLKPNIEFLLGRADDADNSLNQVNTQYPNEGEDEYIRAQILSVKKGDPKEILNNLKIALNDNFVGMGEELWWESIENGYVFAHFRNYPEYNELLNLKGTTEGKEFLGSCKENVRKWQSHWWGPQLYLKESDLKYITDASALAATLAAFVPGGWPVALAIAIVMGWESVQIAHKDKGCGVKINWTWAQFTPGVLATLALFWVTAQD